MYRKHQTLEIYKYTFTYPYHIIEWQVKLKITFWWIGASLIVFGVISIVYPMYYNGTYLKHIGKWTAMSEDVPSYMWDERRLKSTCACAQSDQSIRCPHEETLHSWLSKMRPVTILIRMRENACPKVRFPTFGSLVFVLCSASLEVISINPVFVKTQF